jgi:hypothetical protein
MSGTDCTTDTKRCRHSSMQPMRAALESRMARAANTEFLLRAKTATSCTAGCTMDVAAQVSRGPRRSTASLFRVPQNPGRPQTEIPSTPSDFPNLPCQSTKLGFKRSHYRSGTIAA